MLPCAKKAACVAFLLQLLVMLVALRYVVWEFQDPTGQWGPVIVSSLPSKTSQLQSASATTPTTTIFLAEKVALVRESLLEHDSDASDQLEEKTGAAYVTRSFQFGGKRFFECQWRYSG